MDPKKILDMKFPLMFHWKFHDTSTDCIRFDLPSLSLFPFSELQLTQLGFDVPDQVGLVLISSKRRCPPSRFKVRPKKRRVLLEHFGDLSWIFLGEKTRDFEYSFPPFQQTAPTAERHWIAQTACSHLC